MRDAAVFGTQRIGSQATVVVFCREKGSHPVLLRFGSDGTLSAGDAVPHKFQPINRLRQGQKFAVCIFQPGDLQQVRRVIVHGLHILQQPDVLRLARRHAPEQAHPAFAGVHGKPCHPCAIQFHADPRLYHFIIGEKIHPQLTAGKFQFYAAGCPEQGQRVTPGVPPQCPHLRQLGQRCGCKLLHFPFPPVGFARSIADSTQNRKLNL